MDELGPCSSTYVLLMFDVVCVRYYLCLMLFVFETTTLLFIMIVS